MLESARLVIQADQIYPGLVRRWGQGPDHRLVAVDDGGQPYLKVGCASRLMLTDKMATTQDGFASLWALKRLDSVYGGLVGMGRSFDDVKRVYDERLAEEEPARVVLGRTAFFSDGVRIVSGEDYALWRELDEGREAFIVVEGLNDGPEGEQKRTFYIGV